MTTPTLQSPRRRPVRLPFRLLAALALMTTMVGVVGTFIRVRTGPGATIDAVGNVLMLPLTAWFTRLLWHAARHGGAPKTGESWPLASPGVWRAYSLLLVVYWVYKP